MPSTLSPRPSPKLVSIVIPCYNEEESIPFLRSEISRLTSTFDFAFEVILVNDGSRDDTFSLLAKWARSDGTIRVLSFSRNFGHQAAVSAGLEAAAGDAVVLIDADLQDPVDVIPSMITKYAEGYDVVYGQRLSRKGETGMKRLTAWSFYRLMRLFIHENLPSDTGDFRLVSRRCLDSVLQMKECHRFLRGMFTWVGFNQIAVQYHRDIRKYGVTKYPFRKMVKLAWNAALSFSTFPIKLITYAGSATALFGAGYGVYSIIRSTVFNDTVRGWTTIVVLLTLIGGMILLSIGILGEYIGRIFEQAKGRPNFIIQEKINFDSE